MQPDLCDLPPEPCGLDVGCGRGRHLHGFAAACGGRWIGVDVDVRDLQHAARGAEEIGLANRTHIARADAHHLPFHDDLFDLVICSEVLEHLHDSAPVLGEIVRVVKPDGLVALSVPRAWPERVNWWLSRRWHGGEYQNAPGGHVRVLPPGQLVTEMRRIGWTCVHTHHAHSLHTPYWWLKCAVGLSNEANPMVRAWHGLLTKEILEKPAWLTVLDRALNPLMGKSVVHYFRRNA